jgi:hypothetical protein
MVTHTAPRLRGLEQSADVFRLAHRTRGLLGAYFLASYGDDRLSYGEAGVAGIDI